MSVTATASRSTWKSPSQSHAHTHSRSSHSRPSTTPRAAPAPASVSQNMPPLLTPSMRPPPASQSPRTPSPSYFGFVVNGTSNPPDSNPGHHTRQNWDYPTSQARTAAPTPRDMPADGNQEFEAFRRRSEQNTFTLGHGGFSNFNRPSNSRHNSKGSASGQKTLDSPVSPHAVRKTDQASRPEQDRMDIDSKSFFDIPRQHSPSPMSPARHAVADHQHARLSLPSSNLQTPPTTSTTRPARAETLPMAKDKDNASMITAAQFADLLASAHNEILLLDLRVSPQFFMSRLRGALNLCIPTTLLKRPSFNVQKLEDTFSADKEKAEFARWNQCKYIVVYDSNSTHIKEAITSTHVLKKFITEEWKGHGIIIKGGFAECARTKPSLIDYSPVGQSQSPLKPTLSISPPSQTVAPVAGGCPMPTSKTAANPFFGNIRQNMDLMDGVGQMPIKHPADMSESSEQALPTWLRQVSSTRNEGKAVSDKFLAIEKAEQKRMQEALSGHVSYGSPVSNTPKHVQVAGIEKGSKNRYNNIFPYDHSRVRLQGVSPDSCDYINANYVKAAWSNKRYIATQAPIPCTFNDFWRLVWEQDVRVIVMLTAETEGGQVKSHPYWHTADYGPFKVKNLSEKRVSLESRKPHPKNEALKRPTLGQRRSTTPHVAAQKSTAEGVKSPGSESPSPVVIVRHFTLSHSEYPFQSIREITQLHYSQWPDFGAPTDPTHLLGLMEQTNKCVQESASPTSPVTPSGPAPEGQRPIIVHCSAGCGRTGTFCTVDSVVDMLKAQRKERSDDLDEDHDGMDVDSGDEWTRRDDVDLVAKTVEDFRRQRLSMVQNLRQFVLCYESVLQWVVGQQQPQQSTKGARPGKEKEKSRRSYQG